MPNSKRLSSKTTAVLSLIAEGHSYSQIVDGHPELSYLDIFHAAEEALALNESESDYQERLAKIKKQYPRAYEKWTESEDADFLRMRTGGSSVEQLARHFERQPSAIRSRLAKLGLD